MTNVVNTATAIAKTIPWSEVLNWVFATVIPPLVIWLRAALNKAAQHSTMLADVITAVEQSTKALGQDGVQVKRAIRDASIESGNDLSLDRIVQGVVNKTKL